MYVHARVCTEIMHRWMVRDLKKHRGDVALDLGCGAMRNRPHFRARRYVGVDLDANRLAEGKGRFPDAEGFLAPVEDFHFPGGADIVACVQVLFNHAFEPDAALRTIENAIAHTRPDGCFVFTIAKQNLPLEPDIDARVDAAFDKVQKAAFGRMDFISPLALPVGLVGSLSRSGWAPSDPMRRRVYYYCSGRRST